MSSIRYNVLIKYVVKIARIQNIKNMRLKKLTIYTGVYLNKLIVLTISTRFPFEYTLICNWTFTEI